MADQPRDKVNDLPEGHGEPAFDLGTTAPMTRQEAIALVENLEKLPDKIGDSVSRALAPETTKQPTAVPPMKEQPGVTPSSSDPAGEPGAGGDSVYGATQKLAGALGQVLPGFGQIARIMGQMASIASAVENFANVISPPPPEIEEPEPPVRTAEERAAEHDARMAEIEKLRGEVKASKEAARSEAANYLPLGPEIGAEDIPYQENLPAALPAPPRVAPETPSLPLGEHERERLAALEARNALGPQPPIERPGSGPKGLLSQEQEMELRAQHGLPLPGLNQLPPNEHEQAIPAFSTGLPPQPPAERLPNRGLLLEGAEQSVIPPPLPPDVPEAPVPAPLPVPAMPPAAAQSSQQDEAVSGRWFQHWGPQPEPASSMLARSLKAEQPEETAAPPSFPVPAMPPVAPAATVPPGEEADLEAETRRLTEALAAMGYDLHSKEDAEHEVLPKAVELGKNTTRDEWAESPIVWREEHEPGPEREPEDVEYSHAALRGVREPRVPGFEPLRPMPAGPDTGPAEDVESVELAGVDRMPGGKGVESIVEAAEALTGAAEALTEAAATMRGGKTAPAKEDPSGKFTPAASAIAGSKPGQPAESPLKKSHSTIEVFKKAAAIVESISGL